MNFKTDAATADRIIADMNWIAAAREIENTRPARKVAPAKVGSRLCDSKVNPLAFLLALDEAA